MEGKSYAVVGDSLSISQRFQLNVAQAGPEDGSTRGRGKVTAVAGSRMIRMCVRDHCALDG
jgi:hypothetical protein